MLLDYCGQLCEAGGETTTISGAGAETMTS
jgi:hypothetical protein